MCREEEKEGKVFVARGRENGVPSSITEWAGLLPCGCGMQRHQYFDFSFGNSCVSLFQRYFFLIYRIPQERSISWPWHQLPPLNLGPDRPQLRHTRTRTHSHTCTPAAQKQTLTTDHYSRPLYCLCTRNTRTRKTHKYMPSNKAKQTWTAYILYLLMLPHTQTHACVISRQMVSHKAWQANKREFSTSIIPVLTLHK